MHQRSLPLLACAVIAVLAGCSNPTGSGLERTPGTAGDMVLVPAGSFQRDAGSANISVITQPFWMGRYEVTRAEFLAIMNLDPSIQVSSTGIDDPVQYVNWYHAIAFCNKLSLAEGRTPVYQVTVAGVPINWAVLGFGDVPISTNPDWDAVAVNWDADGYRLPTAMEWMWAAIGADTGNPGQVNTTGHLKEFPGHNGANIVDDYEWFGRNADPMGNGSGSTRPAGTRLPNELGLFDMGGNVIEWCWDWYVESWPTGTQTDYRGGAPGTFRVTRGGSWGDWLERLRPDWWNGYIPNARNSYVGFRVVRRFG